ncbi:hypothetical protein H2200_004292 [Cladophialophora chaetospira]|uniref:Uncharacterized protein n=1 Tax=Cladophialophora chaetospira TaxID=386627 RepID=A0AA38XD01_9EURO|nr:hypothetical protein H2200_004292 [Cladophialophora chaetospira]
MSSHQPRGFRHRLPPRRIQNRPSPPSPSKDSTAQKKFDPETGQVYSEIEIRPRRGKHQDWIRDFNTPHVVTKPAPNAKGARSLADIARSKVVKEFRNLTFEHFVSIPWAIAEKIWVQTVASRSETFHTWRTLAAAYPDAEEFGQRQYRYLIRLKQPSLPMMEYYRGITSSEAKWLTCLRVSPKRLNTQDLVSIHTITNITVLDLSDTGNEHSDIGSIFNERVMISWAQLAASGQAFQNLRVILFGWQQELEHWIFKYTHHFPSLCHIIMTDCPKLHQKNRAEWEPISEAAGWEARRAKRSAKSLRPIIKSEDFAFGSVSGSYYDSQDLFDHLAHSRRPNFTQTLPLLEVWLSTPRQWNHIIDDFPAHRTIWFDNIRTRSPGSAGNAQLSSNREQIKRARNQEQVAGTASPPPKRGPQTRPIARSNGRNLAEVLKEFQA